MKREDLIIEAEELKQIINDPNLRLFDATVTFDPDAEVSDHERYLQGHIPGAAFLDHMAISVEDPNLMFTLPDEDELAEKIGALGVSNDSTVVVYSTGAICWATRVWWVLWYAGHRNVRVIDGGLAAWDEALESGENNYPPTNFEPDYTPSMFATTDEVEAAVSSGQACVINTLTPDIYAGDLDLPYSGHIPGSINNSMFDLVDKNGFLLSDELLHEKLIDRDPTERFITYCGGGIAATTNACIAKMLGFKDVGVYDGSMTEWQSLDKPIAKGAEPGSL